MIAPSVSTTANIRAATPADLPAIERLLAANDLPIAGVRACLDTLVVAESDNEIVGVAGLECCAQDALLRSVAVRSEWRSKGLGRALVSRVISDAEARGMRALYLLTTTAERYFPTFGFQRIERAQVPEAVRATEEFTSACPDTAVAMTRPLART